MSPSRVILCSPHILELLSGAAMDLVALIYSQYRVYELSTTLAMCRSDLGGAKISGTDFSNALVDKTQQIVSSLPGHLDHRVKQRHCQGC